MTPEGIYNGKILSGWLERNDQQQTDDLVMCFECEIGGDVGESYTVTARHMTDGKLGWSGKAVAKLLGLAWPDGLKEIEGTAGRDVRVKIVHKAKRDGSDIFENAYIVTPPAREPATADQIEAGLARLRAKAAEDDNIPF